MDLSPVVVISVLLQFAIVLLSLSVHESAHAWAADRLGDHTGRMLGRITLNPIPHIDPFGTLLFPIMLAVLGLPVFGWAKPVPVISRNLGRVKRDMALIGVAGPLSNLLLTVLVTLILAASMVVLGPTGFARSFSFGNVLRFSPETALEWVAMAGAINVILASFNLIPLPPLDGSWVLSALLPASFQPFFESLRRFGPILLLVLFFTRVINVILLPLFYVILALLMVLPLRFLGALLGG